MGGKKRKYLKSTRWAYWLLSRFFATLIGSKWEVPFGKHQRSSFTHTSMFMRDESWCGRGRCASTRSGLVFQHSSMTGYQKILTWILPMLDKCSPWSYPHIWNTALTLKMKNPIKVCCDGLIISGSALASRRSWRHKSPLDTIWTQRRLSAFERIIQTTS